MVNIFSKIEEQIFFDESIAFDEIKIQEYILHEIANQVNSKKESERPFLFEEIVYDFFEYRRIPLIKTKKTRDFGLDGIIKLNLQMFGELNMGLQIKYKLIDSNDIDLFLSALRNAELQLGIIICKDSRNLQKYELNSKIKAILLSRGIEVKEKLLKDKLDINPILIMKMDEMIKLLASDIRAFIRGIYKK